MLGQAWYILADSGIVSEYLIFRDLTIYYGTRALINALHASFSNILYNSWIGSDTPLSVSSNERLMTILGHLSITLINTSAVTCDL